ncbi:MAG: FemAB family PEP-CTERM system-associated protein [Armatimonadetes bacterium]|nr:FemAB family PEP-CTERM system-associated protein [Armatimonadota bacterium]
MQFVELDNSLESEWTAFVNATPGACLGHDLAWRQVIEDALGHKPVYILATEDGAVMGVCPLFEARHSLLGKRLISVPVLDRAGVLASDERTYMHFSRIFRETMQSNGHKFVQLRCLGDHEGEKAVLTLDISAGADALWKGFKSTVRNQVRKAEKSDLNVRIGGSELVPDFFRVYSRNMRDLGVPTLPLLLFKATLDSFGSNRAHVITINDGLETVGACIEMFFKDTATVPWASSSRSHFDRCPNNLLYWAAIRSACERGCSIFDFGRSTVDTGPYNFKKQWGAVPTPLDWEYYLSDGSRKPEFVTSNPKYRLLVRVWQRLPVPIANLIGPIISKQVA